VLTETNGLRVVNEGRPRGHRHASVVDFDEILTLRPGPRAVLWNFEFRDVLRGRGSPRGLVIRREWGYFVFTGAVVDVTAAECLAQQQRAREWNEQARSNHGSLLCRGWGRAWPATRFRCRTRRGWMTRPR